MLFRVVAICAALTVPGAPAVANAPSMRPLQQPPSMRPLQQPQPLMTLRAEQPAQHPNLDRRGHPSRDDLRTDAIEHNGWIYQAIYPFEERDRRVYPRTLIYSGNGYPATIMICAELSVRLFIDTPDPLPTVPIAISDGYFMISTFGGNCTTVTSSHVSLESNTLVDDPSDSRLRVRYRILAVHRAAP